MLRACVLLCGVLALAGATNAAAETPAAGAPMAGAMPTTRIDLPLTDVHHGQRGQCYTVFEGNVIEPFDFAVKGIMRDYLGPGSSVVLVRLEGKKVEFTGVVAGMSGSPCFIDDKLVGALSYAFASFAKEPIAGITPMADMGKVASSPRPQLPWRLSHEAQTHERTSSAFDGMALAPISTPIALGGCPESVRQHFAPEFEALGFGPLLGTARARSEQRDPLRPGSAVAVVLVRGDMDMAATGTVTWVDGREVLALGHPFMGGGAVSYPMAEASILNTMASQQRSFKMAATGATVGEITQDRLAAIAGTLGAEPKMLPVTGALRVAGKEHTFALEVARDLAMTPKLVAMGLSSALTGRVEARNRGTVKVSSTLRVVGHEPIVQSHVFAAEHDDALLTRAAIASALALVRVWDTPFGPPPEMQLDMQAELLDEPIEERIEAVVIDRAQVRAGDTLTLTVRLRRRGEAPHFVLLPLKVPEAWNGHKVELFIGGANEAQAFRSEVEGSLHPESLSDVLAQLRRTPRAGALHLMAARGGVASHHRTTPLGFVPPSAATLWADYPQTELRAQGMVMHESTERPGLLVGSVRKTLSVVPRL